MESVIERQGVPWHINPRSPDACPAALPSPVESESFSVPADDGIGFDEQEGLAPIGP